MFASYAAILVIVLVLLTILRVFAARGPRICSAHVINMEEHKERLSEIQGYAAAAGLALTRWPAVDGAAVAEKDLPRLGVSKYIYKYAQEHKQPGLIGCFLSHRGLLRHLQSLPCASHDAHLILEDDAYIPPDFFAQWQAATADLPEDWDIVQIGVTFPNLRHVKGRVFTHLADKGNVGGFAYVVRHSALAKICAYVRYMYDPMDVMLRNKHDSWKMFIIWPQICPHNDHGKSVIVKS